MNILDRYGIKEVADVTFYDLNNDGTPKAPVLYLDTLKVSTIEQTAEESDARGGKGNAALISWDYGKEITVTLEDALFSAKSMAIMFGNGTVGSYDGAAAYVMKTEQFTPTALSGTSLPTAIADGSIASATVVNGWNQAYTAPNGTRYAKLNPKFFDATGAVVDDATKWRTVVTAGGTMFCSFDVLVSGAVIDISASSFPGTYYVTGDTFARSEATGKDEFFQFIIPKAKVQSENTITLEAEGDPSVFNMNLKVLRPTDGIMMKLVKYDLAGTAGSAVGSASTVYHNHYLDTDNTAALG